MKTKRMIYRTLLVLSILFISNLNATHLAGGVITYECVGNNQVVFTLRIFQDCGGTNVSTMPQTITSNSGGSLTAYYSHTNVLESDACYDSVYVSCSSAISGSGALEEVVFKTNPITLVGIPPLGGWYFRWSNCCRPGSISNLPSGGGFLIQTIIHPYYAPGSSVATSWTGSCLDSSPEFLNIAPRIVETGVETTIPSFVYQKDNDSLNASFHPVYEGTTTPVAMNYSTGYSGFAPLPQLGITSYHSIDGFTGSINLKSAISGNFATGINYKTFREGQLISEVLLDMPLKIRLTTTISGLCASNAQPTLPSITLSEDSLLVRSPSLTSLNVVNGDSMIFESSIVVGDTFSLFVEGEDYGLLPNCSNQTVTIEALAYHLADSLGNCPDGSCLEVTSLNTNGSLSNSFSSKVKLFWVPNNAQYLAAQQGRSFDIFIKTRDDWCPLPNARYRVIKVKIIDPLPQLPELFSQCVSQESTGTKLTWIPNVDTGDGFNGYVIRRVDTANSSETILDTLVSWSDSVYVDTLVSNSLQHGYAIDVIGIDSTLRKTQHPIYPIRVQLSSVHSGEQTMIEWNRPATEHFWFNVNAQSGSVNRVYAVDSILSITLPNLSCGDTTIYSVETVNGCKSQEYSAFENDTIAPPASLVSWVTIDSANYSLVTFGTVPGAHGYAIKEGFNSQWKYIDTLLIANDSINNHLCVLSDPTQGSVSYVVEPFDSCGNYLLADTTTAFKSLFLSVKKSSSNTHYAFKLSGLPSAVSASSIDLFERDLILNQVTNLGDFSNDSITIPIPVDTLSKQYFAFGAGVGKTNFDLQSNTQVFTSTVGVEEGDSRLVVYPNPTRDVLWVKNINQSVSIQLINSTGVVVHFEETTSGECMIDTARLARGVYSLRIIDVSGRILNVQSVAKL